MGYIISFFIGLMTTVVGLVGYNKIPRLIVPFSWTMVIGCVIMGTVVSIIIYRVLRFYREDKDA